MRRISQSIISVLLLLVLTACSSGKNIKTKEVQKIKKGVTTEQQVLSWFGEPTSSSSDFSRKTKTFLYQYDNQDTLGQSAAGFGGSLIGGVLGPLGALGGSVLSTNTVKGRVETKMLTVVFNTDTSKVVDFNYSKTQGRSRGIGTGTGIGAIGG